MMLLPFFFFFLLTIQNSQLKTGDAKQGGFEADCTITNSVNKITRRLQLSSRPTMNKHMKKQSHPSIKKSKDNHKKKKAESNNNSKTKNTQKNMNNNILGKSKNDINRYTKKKKQTNKECRGSKRKINKNEYIRVKNKNKKITDQEIVEQCLEPNYFNKIYAEKLIFNKQIVSSKIDNPIINDIEHQKLKSHSHFKQTLVKKHNETLSEQIGKTNVEMSQTSKTSWEKCPLEKENHRNDSHDKKVPELKFCKDLNGSCSNVPRANVYDDKNYELKNKSDGPSWLQGLITREVSIKTNYSSGSAGIDFPKEESNRAIYSQIIANKSQITANKSSIDFRKESGLNSSSNIKGNIYSKSNKSVAPSHRSEITSKSVVLDSCDYVDLTVVKAICGPGFKANMTKKSNNHHQSVFFDHTTGNVILAVHQPLRWQCCQQRRNMTHLVGCEMGRKCKL